MKVEKKNPQEDKKKEKEEKSREEIEKAIDEELNQTFPASDPPSYSMPGNDGIKKKG